MLSSDHEINPPLVIAPPDNKGGGRIVYFPVGYVGYVGYVG